MWIEWRRAQGRWLNLEGAERVFACVVEVEKEAADGEEVAYADFAGHC